MTKQEVISQIQKDIDSARNNPRWPTDPSDDWYQGYIAGMDNALDWMGYLDD